MESDAKRICASGPKSWIVINVWSIEQVRGFRPALKSGLIDLRLLVRSLTELGWLLGQI
jgi:hypothetical protein